MNESSLHAAGLAALNRLFQICLQHEGGSTRPIAQFLVSLYNSRYAKVDAYLLCRRIDDAHFADVIAVMQMFRDAPGRPDVHLLVENGEQLVNRIMEDFGYSPNMN